MKKRILVLGIGIMFLLAPVLSAAVKKNPDSNTLWIEGWESLEFEQQEVGSGWGQKYANFELKDGGKVLLTSKEAGKPIITGRYVDFSREYPYLQIKVAEIERIPNYQGMALSAGGMLLEIGGGYFPGIYTFEIINQPELSGRNEGMTYLRFDLYGGKFLIDWIKMVRKPVDAVIVTKSPEKEGSLKKGDKVVLEVSLAEKAADVTVDLLTAYLLKPATLDGQPYIQLKKADGEGKVWKAEITAGEKSDLKKLKAGGLLFRANVLGGKIKQTFTANLWNIELE